MQRSHFLIKLLRENVNFTLLVLIVVAVVPKFELCENLARERARHHERWVASGAA